MRTYLVVIDETDEASVALRFASRRAMKTNSALHILALVGAPGPLVSHFANTEAGTLPCPVMVVPGSLTKEEIDRLS